VNQELVFVGFDQGRSGAVLSECGTYRYRLDRWWDDGQCVAWLMLNPSTADASTDDATIRKCKGFSKRWGYGRMIVVNLFALRSTDPRRLAKNTDPVGPENDWYLQQAFQDAREIVCAWGCNQHLTPELRKRIPRVLSLAVDEHLPDRIVCLGYSKDGTPRHPLMLGYDTERRIYGEAENLWIERHVTHPVAPKEDQ
jgi:hypothetical protein